MFRQVRLRRRATIAATAAALAALATAGGAQADPLIPCDQLDTPCPPEKPAIQNHLQIGFDSFTVASEGGGLPDKGQIRATAGGAFIPPNPVLPPSPSAALAEGKLYLQGADDFFAIGKLYPPDPMRPSYLFDGHLVPASIPPNPVAPPDPITFVGKYWPPVPIPTAGG
jgi:hypothetical protein